MGQRDYCLKRYLSDEARFADLINGILCDGQQLVSPDDLSELDSQVGFRTPEGQRESPVAATKGSGQIKYRDLLKKAAFGVNFIVIGIEHQEHPNYLMPLRCMGYDVREYERQAMIEKSRLRRWNKMRRKSVVIPDQESGSDHIMDLTSAEFLSGYRKNTRLHPCITLVLYFGEKWDAANSLHQLLDFSSIPEPIRRYVNDYNMYLIDVKRLQNSDTEKFRTDLRLVFDCIRFSDDKEHFVQAIQKNQEYESLEEDAYDMIARYTKILGERKLSPAHKKEGGVVDMCKAMQELLADERAEGRAEGHLDGKRDIIKAMFQNGLSQEIVMQMTSISREEMSFLLRDNACPGT